MPGRRSRSRSLPRRRRSSNSPSSSRQWSDRDRSRYSRRNERERMVSSSDARTRDRHRSPSREKSKEPRPGHSDPPPMDSSKVHDGDKSTADQENQQEKKGDNQSSQPKERGTGRLSSLVHKEKNVLFPSGSNTVNRGRDRVRDRSWREERGRMVSRRGHSEGIMARENVMEDRQERRQLDTFVDPREVPRNGNYFEHDDRDAPQPSYNSRPDGGFRRRERRYQRSPERRVSERISERVSERVSRDGSRYRGRDTWDRLPEEQPRRDWGRRSVRERLGSRSSWSDDRRRGGGRDKSPMHWRHDLFEDGNRSRVEPEQQRRYGGGRDRSPMHWKHDLYEEDDQSPEPKESLEQKQLKLKMEEAVEDFNIDDILCMDNPITKMDFDV